ncbi:XRE family transcriptional regulator [Halieaceae bacterium IMCC14734]|uniref:XRE family transcriptional regulator n=1 Tax=Candidatus Litorirhabdus singularis TaxID=2518993 RepID=A0ABT3TK73_9GAMM|nr:helix-turn-helix transcriptional regulator [Candidatus Litorirhabdus singularis]MCX2982705.1 XRE family transcriptional regulator [Candidatus Litorirhabdus singularis]
METYLRVIGQNVRSTRKAQGVSQEALADMAGIDRSHMGFIERGKKDIRISTLVKVAGALNVDPAKLFEC